MHFFFSCYGDHRDLHSFPTRRSSDLDLPVAHHRQHCRPYAVPLGGRARRSEEHTSELQSRVDLVCRLLLEKKNFTKQYHLRGLAERAPDLLTAGHRVHADLAPVDYRL